MTYDHETSTSLSQQVYVTAIEACSHSQPTSLCQVTTRIRVSGADSYLARPQQHEPMPWFDVYSFKLCWTWEEKYLGVGPLVGHIQSTPCLEHVITYLNTRLLNIYIYIYGCWSKFLYLGSVINYFCKTFAFLCSIFRRSMLYSCLPCMLYEGYHYFMSKASSLLADTK